MGSRWSPSADGGAPGGGSQARLLLQTACATRWPSRPPFASKRPEDKIAPKMTRRAPRSPPRAWAGSAPPARLIVNCGGFRPPCGRSGPAPTSNRTPGPTRGVGHDQTPLHSSALSLHPGRTPPSQMRGGVGRGRDAAPQRMVGAGNEPLTAVSSPMGGGTNACQSQNKGAITAVAFSRVVRAHLLASAPYLIAERAASVPRLDPPEPLVHPLRP